MMPARGNAGVVSGDAEGEAMARTSSFPVRIRFPCRRTLSRSCAVVSRWCRGKRQGCCRCDGGVAVSDPRYVLAGDADRQVLAPLLAATAEDFAPPLRGHACAETVIADALLVPRAICGLAHECSKPEFEVSGYRSRSVVEPGWMVNRSYQGRGNRDWGRGTASRPVIPRPRFVPLSSRAKRRDPVTLPPRSRLSSRAKRRDLLTLHRGLPR